MGWIKFDNGNEYYTLKITGATSLKTLLGDLSCDCYTAAYKLIILDILLDLCWLRSRDTELIYAMLHAHKFENENLNVIRDKILKTNKNFDGRNL